MTNIVTERAPTANLAYALNTMIRASADAERGYAAAAADVRDPAIKQLLLGCSNDRAQFVMALQAAVQGLGAFVESAGTFEGLLRRGWMAVRHTLETERAVIEECERGERAAIHAYDLAASRTPLASMPPEIRAMIEQQYAKMQASLAELRNRLALH